LKLFFECIALAMDEKKAKQIVQKIILQSSE